MRKGGALIFGGWESERSLSRQAWKKVCEKVKSWFKTGKKKKWLQNLQSQFRTDGKNEFHWEVEAGEPRVRGLLQIPKVCSPSGLQAFQATRDPVPKTKRKSKMRYKEPSTFRLQRSEAITSLAAVGVLWIQHSAQSWIYFDLRGFLEFYFS